MEVIAIGAFGWLLEAMRKAKVFKCDKVSLRQKVKACIMYMAGLSYRGMTVVSGLIPASHVAVYYWVQKLKGVIGVCKPRVRRGLAVRRDQNEGERPPPVHLGCDRCGFQGGSGRGCQLATLNNECGARIEEGFEVMLE